MTVPTFSIYEPSGKWIIEGHGVDPDIPVDEDPTLLARGVDGQLERAIQEGKLRQRRADVSTVDEMRLVIGEKLLRLLERARLAVRDAEDGEVREVDRAEHGEATGLVFSPDSAWLAWSHPGPRPLRQLKLANTADLSVSEATQLRFRDYSPAFTLDGKHLAFLSMRSFDPIYDEHAFDGQRLDEVVERQQRVGPGHGGEVVRALAAGGPDVEHAVVALEAGVLVDVFTPAREDFLRRDG